MNMKHFQHVFLVVSDENFPLQGQTNILLSIVPFSNTQYIWHLWDFVTSSPKISWSIPASKRHIAIDIDFASVTRKPSCAEKNPWQNAAGHQMEFRDIKS